MEDGLKFSGADAHLVVHATEDQDKILHSLQNLLEIPPDKFSIVPSDGHYKNKIMMAHASFSSSEANDLAQGIASGLNSSDRQELTNNIDQFSDEKGNLYLRLDKQRLCQGKISLASADVVRIKFKPVKRYRPRSSMESYRGLFSSE
jgi:RNA binding exosome subunit